MRFVKHLERIHACAWVGLAFGFAACQRYQSPWQPSAAASTAPISSTAGTAAATPTAILTPAAPAAKTAGRLQVWSSTPIGLPGADGPVSLDLLFFEAQRSRVWVPAGGTGSVDVFDVGTQQFTRIEGFKTKVSERNGKKRMLGPSAGAIGDGFAYIGNRASDELCVVDLRTLEAGFCLKLSAAPDAVAFIQSTHQVWVTTPSNQSIVLLDASASGAIKESTTIPLDGEPECYAVDGPRGSFFTNLEDKGTTLSIDLKTHAVKNTWSAGCSTDGPRGVAVDSARALLLVACTDHVQALSLAQGGARLGRLETGAGVDNIDYVPLTGMVYAAAAKAGRLTVAQLSDQGEFSVANTAETVIGARNAVVDTNGNAYLADPQGAHLLVLRSAPSN